MEPLEKPPPTLLVVEDEHLIRSGVADFLRECGWRVLEAASAAEAIEILESGAPIELVFSDIQMPGAMDGFGLGRWVREHRPGVRVILTSGVIGASDAATALCDEGPIAKPYDYQHLAERIRHHLGAGIGPALA